MFLTTISFFPHSGNWLPAGKMLCWQQHEQVILGRVLVWVSVLLRPLDFHVLCEKEDDVSRLGLTDF